MWGVRWLPWARPREEGASPQPGQPRCPPRTLTPALAANLALIPRWGEGVSSAVTWLTQQQFLHHTVPQALGVTPQFLAPGVAAYPSCCSVQGGAGIQSQALGTNLGLCPWL